MDGGVISVLRVVGIRRGKGRGVRYVLMNIMVIII